MKIYGIICEYNPLHNGHLQHLRYVKSLGDTVVCVMSGNFTQRGEIACVDKYIRAQQAIKAGADIVIELPVTFACASAQNFAFGAIRILDALNCFGVCFGSECGDIEEICSAAKVLQGADTNNLIKGFLAAGVSYPIAVDKALTQLNCNVSNRPNNILALEYVKSIYALGSKMVPVTIKREDNYDTTQIINNTASSTALREAMRDGNIDIAIDCVPDYVYNALDCKRYTQAEENYHSFIHSYLTAVDLQTLSTIEGISEGLHHRIKKASTATNYEQMMLMLKTRRYTLTKLQRVLANAALGITAQITKSAKQAPPYSRILAISQNRQDLLPYIARSNLAVSNLNDEQTKLSQLDIKASNLYATFCGEPGNKDFTTALQKV